MQFSYDVTIPASTPVTTPHEEHIRLDTGVLTNVGIRFKPGCHNRVYVAIFDALIQLIPAHQTRALYGDDTVIRVPMNYPLTSTPYELIVKGWSPDTRYDHTLTIWLDLIDTAQEKKSGGLSSLLHILGQ